MFSKLSASIVSLVVVAATVGYTRWTSQPPPDPASHGPAADARPLNPAPYAPGADAKPAVPKKRRPMTALPRTGGTTGHPLPGKWIKYPADNTLPEGLVIEVTEGVITGVIDENPGKPAEDMLGTRYVVGYLDATDITPALWRLIDLEMPKPDGSIAKLSVGRPLWWMQQTGARAGATIDLGMQEIGISGKAKVLRIGAWTEDSRDNPHGSNIVTGKIEHQNAVVWDPVFNRDEAHPLGVTANHPLYSSDRDGWVPAGELKIDEKVRTIDGTATLTGKTQRQRRG